MKRLNIKLLVWLIVTPAVLAVGIHFLHAFQIDRNAGSLKAQAEEAAKEGKNEDAIRQYSQYLKHRGDDAAAYAEFAGLVADAADKPDASRAQVFRAYQVMEEATRRHGDLTDVRKRLIDYCMKYGRFRDAIDHIDRLRSDGQAKDAKMDVKYAQCLLATGREEKAVKLLSEVLGFDSTKQEFSDTPGPGASEIDAYVLLAEVFRRQADDSKVADLVTDQLVKANPESAKAHADRGRFRQRQKRLIEADADLTEALRIAPKDADVIISAAEVAGAVEDFERANKLLADGLKEHSDDERFYRSLASIALQQSKPEVAMKYVDEGLAKAPGNQFLLLFRADLELQKGDIEGVRATVNQMREKEFLPELIEYIECRILVAERQWLNATRQLERLRPLMARFPDLTLQIDLLLGQSYQAQGQPDRAVDAFRRALDTAPDSIPARLGYAEGLRAIGKGPEAEMILRKLQGQLAVKENAVSSAVNNSILQLAVSDEMRKPEAERNWDKVDAVLADVLKSDSLTEVQESVLEAEIAMLKKDLKRARAVLSAAVKEHPKELAVWLGLMNLVAQDKESKFTPEQILDRAEKALGPVLQLRQVRLANAVRKPGKEAAAAVKAIEGQLETLNEAERIAMLADLGNAYYRLKDYEQARRCWLEVSKARPDDTKILLTLFELAMEFGDEKDMDATLEEIRKTSLTNSSLYKFCEAERMVWRVKQKKAEASELVAAGKVLAEARKIRPEWHEIARLGGEINELQGKSDDAIAEFQRALELGPPNPNIARRLVALLYQRGRFVEVEKAMKYVGEVGVADPINRVKVDQKLRLGQNEDALDDARKVVEAEPDNVANLFWYGQLLSRAGRDDDATKVFRQAMEKDPANAQGWLLLVAHLANAKQLLDAKDVIRDAKSALAKDAQEAFLAQAYELVGDAKAAEENYLALLAAKPQDTALLRSVAAFYLRTNQISNGQKQIEVLLALPAASDAKASEADRGNVMWARRAMAQVVAKSGEYRDLMEAISLLEANKIDGKLPAEDMLLAAGLLAKRADYSSRKQALKWLEQVQETRSLSPEELFLVAQLYEQTGDWSKAREAIVNVLTKVEGNAMLNAAYAQMLIRHDDLVEAERWVEKFESAQPGSAIATELKARLLVKQGKPEEAADLLVKLVDRAPNENAKLQLSAAIVAMLEEFEQFTTAEQLLRSAVEDAPRARISLASYLGRHGELDEAFDLYEESRKSYPLPVVVQGAIDSLRRRSTEAKPAQFAKVEQWLKSAIEEDPKSVNLMLQQIELQDIKGQTEEVVSSYRQLMANKDLDVKQRAIISNNLSFVLAMRGGKADVEEAIKLINDAIAVLGPASDLLDTRAVCYLAQGDTKRALDDLRAAIIDAPSPVKYMHLAMAESRSGDKAAAAKSLAKARELKFEVNTLSARERENYTKLIAEIEGK